MKRQAARRVTPHPPARPTYWRPSGRPARSNVPLAQRSALYNSTHYNVLFKGFTPIRTGVATGPRTESARGGRGGGVGNIAAIQGASRKNGAAMEVTGALSTTEGQDDGLALPVGGLANQLYSRTIFGEMDSRRHVVVRASNYPNGRSLISQQFTGAML